MIKNIILDLDGTIYAKKSVVELYLKEFCEKINLDFNKTHNIFSKSFLEAKKITHSNTIKFWEKVHKIFLNSIKQSDKIILLNQLAKKANKQILLPKKPRQGVISFLKKAKKANIKIIIFTGSNNMYNSIDLTKDKEEYFKLLAFKEKQLKNMKIDKYIDKLILSHKYFGFKPQKKVFEKLLHELNAKPQECIMIGDSYNDMGATQLNIFSILMSKKKCKEFTPNYIVNSFDEISKIIDFETCELKI